MAGPQDLEALFAQAMQAHQAGRIAEAQQAYKALLKAVPRHPGVLHFLGLSYFQAGQPDKGISLVQEALAIKPDYHEAHYNLATTLHGLKRFDEAVQHYKAALAADPTNADAHNNLGAALSELKRYEEAIVHFERALALDARSLQSHNNIGVVLRELNRHHEAVAQFETAVALTPDNVEAHCNLGAALLEVRRFDEALTAYERAVALQPDFADASLGRGNALARLKRGDQALASFDRALGIKPDLAEAWLGRGNVLFELERWDDALAAWDRALALKPDLAEAWFGRGNAFQQLKRLTEAFEAYDRAMALRPTLPGLEGIRLYTKRNLANWSNLAAESEHLIGTIGSGNLVTPAFALLSVPTSLQDQLRYAKGWIATHHPPWQEAARPARRLDRDRIRVAYLSGDFRQHAVSWLLAGVFESHDKSRFETIGVSWGSDDKSKLRERVRTSFDRFIEVDQHSDVQVATTLRDMEIDIAVDLMGFTQGARTNILAGRPAPIQVNYLGYPGTMGAPYIDYVLADGIVIPEDCKEFYTEKIVHLPHSFHATDRKRPIAEMMFERTDMGLPQQGFVFCCFNGTYKITPDVFDCWMRLLKQVDNSVLWLLSGNPAVESNLRHEAIARGVSPERLVFVPRLPVHEHQALWHLADLFLDNLPFNAGTTASDALWSGVPVLTRIGNTFAGRMAASILNAIGLPELITTTQEEYERLAIRLATDPSTFGAIKRKLADNRLTTPLFDTRLFTQHIEAAFSLMYERQQAGLLADHIVVPN